jgi:hypothetical protein
MKKIFSLLLSSLVVCAQVHAQAATTGSLSNNKTITAQMKSGIQSKMAYTSGTGNILTASITNQLSTPLSLTADQKKAMNDALYNFFTAKGSFLNLRNTDNASYQQQQNDLLAGFMKTLSGFLSANQVAQFTALKPPASGRSGLLAIVFY